MTSADLSVYTDRLLFRAYPDARNDFLAGWSGPWPPPERMGLASGSETGRMTAFDPMTVDSAAVAAATGPGSSITVTMYRRYSASEITERAPADANWFRGALYVRESP